MAARGDPDPRSEREGASTESQQRIQAFLGEVRIIVPGLGALLGFQLHGAFQPTFDTLPPHVKLVNLLGVVSTTIAFVCLLMPAAYHRLAARLDESESFLDFARVWTRVAFAFLSGALTAALYIQGYRAFEEERAGVLAGAAMAVMLAIMWWLVPRMREGRRTAREREKSRTDTRTA